MKLTGIPVKGARVDKSGKLVKFTKPRDASHKQRMIHSKKVRVAKKGQTP